MTIKEKIQSLLTAANTKTGETDTTLTDAVQTLIDGYGQGGGLPMSQGTFTMASNGNLTPTITHNLGTQSVGILVWLPNNDSANAQRRPLVISNINVKGIFDGYTVDVSAFNTAVDTITYDAETSSSSIYIGIQMHGGTATDTSISPGYSSLGTTTNYAFQSITDNSFVFRSAYAFQQNKTYHYVVYALPTIVEQGV